MQSKEIECCAWGEKGQGVLWGGASSGVSQESTKDNSREREEEEMNPGTRSEDLGRGRYPVTGARINSKLHHMIELSFI